MKSKKLPCLLTYALTLLAAAVFAIILSLSYKTPPGVKEIPDIADLGENTLTASRISDFSELNTIPFAMYTPNEFIKPGQNPGQIENEVKINLNTKPRSDARGTYRFVILNLDPNDENFNNTAEKMTPFLQGDNSYHFTMYLPAIWSACTVYINYTLYTSIGELSNYNYIDYSNYIGETVLHKDKTEPLYIDLSFYSKRSTLPPSTTPIIAAKIITVHFESKEGAVGGLSNMPLIGLDKAVRNAVNADKSLTSAFSIFAGLTLAVFVFLCFLKRTLSYLPQQLVIFGILGTLIFANALLSATNAPFLALSMRNLFFALIPLATTLSLRVKIKNFPIWIPFSIFALVGCLIFAISPLVSIAANILTIIKTAIFIIEGLMLITITIARLINHTEIPLNFINPALCAVIIFTSAFLPSALTAIANPIFWLLAAMLIVSVITSFYTFSEIERKNRYLTANLKNEVTRQTEVLQSIVTERDKLLGRVSHDLKKPVRSIRQFLNTLKDREADSEQIKTIKIISQKTDDLIKEFDELGNYAKLNFATEQSTQFDIKKTLEQIYESLNPDCVANGIVLNLSSPNIAIYGKEKCLISVINNLIINALEHSNCTKINLTAYKKKDFCHICVTDNGIGIDKTKNIFEPYYSDSNSQDNNGLGLYICKSLIGSMGGTLDYYQENKKLTFTISLPLAY